MTAVSIPRWASWHLHVGTLGGEATDRVVRHVVGPAVQSLCQSGATTSWFFVRYWQYGPHVRFRVGGLPTRHHPSLDRLLRAQLAEALDRPGPRLTNEEYQRQAAPLAAAGEEGRRLDIGRLWPCGVYRQRYQPEVSRYGGPTLLPTSEELFAEASALALAFLQRDPPETARSGLGLRATGAALEVLDDDDHRLRFCQRAAAGWQGWADRASGSGGLPVVAPPGRSDAPMPAPVQRWADRLGHAMARWRAVAGESEAERILHSHVHMLHNRLGLSVGQEWINYAALAQSITTLLTPAGAS